MPKDDPIDHFVAAIEWIQQHRAEPGKRLARSTVSTESGLTRSHLEQITSRRQKSVDMATAVKVARRWNVRINWMITGDGPIEPFDASEAGDDTLAAVLDYYENRDRWSEATRQAATSMRFKANAPLTQEDWVRWLDHVEAAIQQASDPTERAKLKTSTQEIVAQDPLPTPRTRRSRR